MIDKRTGKPFPSLLAGKALEALAALPNADENRTYVDARRVLDQQLTVASQDTTNDWTLDLDPHSMMGSYGAFMDLADDRPIEWFQEAGRRIHDELTSSDALWTVINAIFDAAIIATDADVLGIDPPAGELPQENIV